MSGQHTGGESEDRPLRHRFAIWQDGVKVAGGEAPDYQTALREGQHYAMMYAQDAPVRLTVNAIYPRKRRAAIALASPSRENSGE